MMMKLLSILFSLAFFTTIISCTSAFSPIPPSSCASHRASTRSGCAVARRSPAKPTFLHSRAPNDDDDTALEEMDEPNSEGGLDVGGFAGYLAPYALAAIASIGVTAAFVKFVLMDY
mmetsp:Transcript_16927/g.28105  ORF Transcript_16927/g.28105 Transcript_16927/m.28105 type:complete len:117 (+) Transcript_16927:94-444(+)